MFLRFASQDDRKKYGGSCFIEMQFCFLPASASSKRILNSHDYWRDDSLYIHGDSPFYTEYKDVFGKGLYHNMSEGSFDPYGITYYKADLIDGIIRRALELKPEEHELLIEWLEEAKKYNGFYILGI